MSKFTWQTEMKTIWIVRFKWYYMVIYVDTGETPDD